MNRSDWEKLDHDERWLRVSEGVIVREDDWEQQEIRRERVRLETEQWNRDHAPPKMKLKDFNVMTQAERDAYIRGGGIVVD